MAINTFPPFLEIFQKYENHPYFLKSFLLFFIRHGDLNYIISLHQNGRIHIPSPLVMEIIENAASCGRVDIIRYFHENGISLNILDEDCLKNAIINDHDTVLRYFHQNGFELTESSSYILASLCYTHGSLKCFEYLFKNSGFVFFNEYEINKAFFKFYCHEKNTFLFSKEKYTQNSSQFIKSLCIINNDNTEGFIYYISRKYFESNKTDPFSFTNLKNPLFISYLFNNHLTWDQKDLTKCLFLSAANGNFLFVQCIIKDYPFLMEDERGIEVFELALINNRKEIVSFFLSFNPLFLRKRDVIQRLAKSASQFCDILTLKLLIDYYKTLNVNINVRLLYFAALHKRLDIVKYLNNKKGVPLQIFLKVRTECFPEGPVREFLSDRRCLNELKGDLNIIKQMGKEIINDEKIFHPSKFWNFFNDVNITVLKESGFKNFKRSINQNYFNFIPTFLTDSFFKSIVYLRLFRFIKSPAQYELVDPDIINDDGELKTIYRRVFQKNRTLSLYLYKYTIGTLWDYVKERDPEGLLQRLEEPKLGNPIEIKNNQNLISQDLANSVQEFYFVYPYIQKIEENPIKIVEIGAGYGRLGYVLLNALKCKYIVFDIPPALYVSQKYLSEIFLNKKIFSFRHFNSFDEIKDELEKSDIAFFTINQIKYFPKNYSNICINISSLHEMGKDQIHKISGYMSEITKDFIYIKQYKKYKNPFDKTIIKEKDYKFPDLWERVNQRTTPSHRRFFESILQKKSF